MSEKIVTINPNQKVTAKDLSSIGLYARSALDHVVTDGINSGVRGYTGFNAVKTAQTKVTVGSGRLFGTDGAVYFYDSDAGQELNFLTVLPAVSQRIVAIVVTGAPQDTQTQAREFVTNTVTGETEAIATSTQNWRTATIGFSLGSEAASPLPPAVNPNELVVAYLTLNPTSVVEGSVKMNDDNRLRSSRDAYTAALALKASVDSFGPKLVSIGNDVSAATQAVSGKADAELLYRALRDVAELKKIAKLPDAYIDYASDNFYDDSLSDKTEIGYNAKIQEGLRFPPINTATTSLGLLNQNDAKVYKDPTGLILPTFKETRTRLVSRYSGNLSLNSIAYTTDNFLKIEMSPSRNRYGPEYVTSSNSDFWKSLTSLDSPFILYGKDGQTYQTYPSNITNADGSTQIRYRQLFTDKPTSNYWNRTTPGATTFAGYKYAQTFLNARNTWATGLGIFFATIDTAGGLTTLMLCECLENGQPNDQRILATTSFLPNAITGAGIYQHFPITPTFLEQGKQYGILVSTAANHIVQVSDTFDSQIGSFFYKTGSGYWQPDPSTFLMCDLWYAEFNNVLTEVQLNSISLAGGIASLDVIAQSIVPDTAALTFLVEVGGVKIPLTPENIANFPFASLPDTLPLYLRFNGSPTIQPSIILNSSQVKASRPNTTLKHFSAQRTLPTATTKIRTITRIENFDSARHTVTPKIKVGGTEYAAGVATDRVVSPGIIERTAFFTLGAATTTFKRVTQAITDTVTNLCVISEVDDIATSA